MRVKKALALVLTGCLAASALTACGSKGGDAGAGASKGDQVSISMLNTKVEINDALKAAIDTYMGQNPNVKITMETVGGGADAGGALKTKLNGGSMPTIYAIGGPQSWFEWKDRLEDLSDQPWVANLPDSTLTAVKNSEGKVVGLPYSIEGYGYVYNKKIFEAAGIDGETLKSYEDIDAAFTKLKTMIDNGELKDQYPNLEAVMEFPIKETWVTGLHTLNLELNKEYESNTDVFDAKTLGMKYSAELKDLIDFQVKYTTSAKNPKALNSVDYSSSIGGGLSIERVAVVQQGNWINTEVASVDPELGDNLGIIPIPMKGLEEGKLPVGVPSCYCVDSQATDEQKKAAKDFLNWLFQSEEGKKIVMEEFKFVPAFNNYDGLEPQDALSKVVKQYSDDNNTSAWVFDGTPNGFMDFFGIQVQSYVSGSSTWDEVIKACQDEWVAKRG